MAKRKRAEYAVLSQGEAVAQEAPGPPGKVGEDAANNERWSYSDDTTEDGMITSRARETKRRLCRPLTYVRAGDISLARSAYEGYKPALLITREPQAIETLRAASERLRELDEGSERPPYTIFKLDDFCIYRNPAHEKYGSQLASLHNLQERNGFAELYFDGVLSVGTTRRCVQAVPFDCLTVEGYGDVDLFSLEGKICIQSRRGAAALKEVWYELGRPAPEYARFWRPFYWLAQFTKYFVDFLLEHDAVTINEFRCHFNEWLCARYNSCESEAFRRWQTVANLTDYRTTVVANVGYLWKECYSVDEDHTLRKQPVWMEVDPQHLRVISREKNTNVDTQTVVTPYLFDCFKQIYFGSRLAVCAPTTSYVSTALESRKKALKLTPGHAADQARGSTFNDAFEQSFNARTDAIAPGDVVCVTPDERTVWKHKSDSWFAYVQDVRIDQAKILDVLWLYEPRDTTLGNALYPFKNELFFSDNCSCGKDAIEASAVIGKLDVTLFATDPSSVPGFFVRQKFRTAEVEAAYDFVTLKSADFSCRCKHHLSAMEDTIARFYVGETVLVRQYDSVLQDEVLNPAQIVAFDLEKSCVAVRRILRRVIAARPNELTLTNELYKCAPSRIVRECYIRYFTAEEKALKHIPPPYSCDGAGDYFYIVGGPEVSTDDDSLPPLHQGFDPRTLPEKCPLNGMGIFCGGGNFDRGLEEGGAVKFKHAIDWAEHALHSYRANLEDPESVQLFLGSVNDYLAQAIAGSRKANIAEIGEVDVISAGSPCPGYSALQNDKNSALSQQNASMVASVMAYVDFYSPKHCLLENVVTMASGQGPRKDEPVFSQILCVLVGMGYQVQQCLMDAWSHSSPSSRSRVFIIATAPGLLPLPQPSLTHSHPNMRSRSLGRSSNGLPFGQRKDDVTPFTFVSASNATRDLPDIGEGQVQLCPAFPDHRVTRVEDNINRTRIEMVPRQPLGMGYVQAVAAGKISEADIRTFYAKLNRIRKMPNSTAWSRMYPDGQFPTVTTAVRINDGISGRCIHWNQHRTMTVLEARRALSFPDHDVIVGSPAQQLAIVGNSVDRKVSLVLGLGLRASWLSDESIPRLSSKQGLGFSTASRQRELENVFIESQPPLPRARNVAVHGAASTFTPPPLVEVEDSSKPTSPGTLSSASTPSRPEGEDTMPPTNKDKLPPVRIWSSTLYKVDLSSHAELPAASAQS